MLEHREAATGQPGTSIKPAAASLPSSRLMTSSQVWLNVEDVMSRDPITVSSDQPVLSAAKRMCNNGVSSVIAMDRAAVAGILTETDFLNWVADRKKPFFHTKVAAVMSSPVVIVSSDRSVFDASRTMEENKIKRLPVLKDNRLVGIVTQTDLVRVLTSYGMWRDVAEIMSRDVVTIDKKTSVAEAAELMAARRISCIVVVGGDEAVGVLTERDLLKRVVARQKDARQMAVENVMSSPVISVAPSYSVFSASRAMEERSVRRLVVTENRRLRGIVAQTDIFRVVRRKLQQKEDENLRALEESESPVYTMDLDGNTTYVNPAFAKLLEVSGPRELIGRPFLPDRFWHTPSERQKLLAELETGTAQAKKLALKTAGGRSVQAVLLATPIQNAHGQINGRQGVLYDLTQKAELVTLRKTHEALRHSARAWESSNHALREAKLAAEQANRAKDEFLRSFSHKLRDPVLAILGSADILSAEAGADARPRQRADALETIRRNGSLVLELVNSHPGPLAGAGREAPDG